MLGNHLHMIVEADSDSALTHGMQDHYRSRPTSSDRHRVLADPRTWLLKAGWRRARRVPHWLRSLRSESL